MPTQCIYEFVWILEQIAIIFLYSTKCLVFKPRQSVFIARYELYIGLKFSSVLVFQAQIIYEKFEMEDTKFFGRNC